MSVSNNHIVNFHISDDFHQNNEVELKEITNGDGKDSPTLSPPSSPAEVIMEFRNLQVFSNNQPLDPITGLPVNGRLMVHSINGKIYENRFVALMGPSGSGKTSLLNALACRLQTNVKAAGDLRLYGKKYSQRVLKMMAAYVMQDDLLNENLTVEETLIYSAHLRMDSKFTEEERLRRVEEVIELVGLSHAKNTIIGSPLKRGISGGERKRVCVAMELLSFPKLLFLDEMTSGLDSTTSLSLCRMLKELCRRGECTVIASIHQPQKRIFDLFDDLYILKSGNLVFSGKASEAGSVWKAAGLKIPPEENIADFLIDSISTNLHLTNHHNDPDKNDANKNNKTVEDPVKAIQSAAGIHSSSNESSDTLKVGLTSRHQKQPSANGVVVDDVMSDELIPHRKNVAWPVQLKTLIRRVFKDQMRRKRLFLWGMIQSILQAVLIGTVFLRIGTSQSSTTRRQPVLFFCCINQGVFAAFQVVNNFPSERVLTLRERASGAYNVSAYFLAKTIAEFPFQIAQPIVFSIVVYFLVGLQAEAGKFFVFLFFIILCSYASVSLTLMISAAARTTNNSVTIMPFVFELCRLFGGFFLPPAQLPDYHKWLDALSYVKYAYTAISLNELTGLEIYCTPSQLNAQGKCPITSGQQTIATLGLNYLTIVQCGAILVCYIIICRIFTYAALRYVKW